MAEKFAKVQRVGVNHMEFYLILLNVDAGMTVPEAASKVLGTGDKFEHFKTEIAKWEAIRRSV